MARIEEAPNREEELERRAEIENPVIERVSIGPQKR
jgi:hypothetical protein